MILIDVINQSTKISDDDVESYIPAFEQQWNTDLQKVWGVESSDFLFIAKGQMPRPGSQWLVYLDNSDQAGALAYHDLTNQGLPLSKVFVESILADGDVVSVAATHELCEMAVDPWLNSAYQDMKGTFWAGEIADPVEGKRYAYSIGGVLVTDFVTPNWFGHQHSQAILDLENHCTKQFQILSDGYAQYFVPRHGWAQVIGQDSALKSRAMIPIHGSRREKRVRGHSNWQASNPTF